MHCKIPDRTTHRIAMPGWRSRAFTITELLVASAILVAAVSLSLAGHLHMLREMHASDAQVQLDVDIQASVERIKRDVRLSSLEKMFFFPEGPGPYTAMSFPMARDDNGDGVVDKDADDEIIWDRTVVYHVWNGEPHQLRRTVFDPRLTELTDSERQAQLNAVASTGSGAGTVNGASATTDIVFENLFEWELSPRGAVYDAYAPSETRAPGVCLRSCLLDAGPHTITFTTRGKNPDSTGYHVGIDSLAATPSGSPREGEDLYPPESQLGAIAEREYMQGGSWSGNYQLLFPATAAEQHVSVEINNDLIKETNFSTPGDQLDRVEVMFDETQDPHDFVLSLLGNSTNWTAEAQTGTAGTSVWEAAGSAVRVVLRGEDMAAGNWINFDGSSCRVRFDIAEGSHATIAGAYIGKCAGATTNIMDVVPGTQQPVLFSGSSSTRIDGGASAWSDDVDVTIERTNSYAISYLIETEPASAAVRHWDDTINQGLPSTFVIPPESAPGVGDTAAPTWSGLTNAIAFDGVLGVAAMHSGFPGTGTYVSAVFDTHCDTPAYNEINWDADVPSGTAIELKIRTGMEIFRDIRSHSATKRLRSKIAAEINPRNTGL